MIGPPDWMLQDLGARLSHSQAGFTSREGYNNQGQHRLYGFYVAQL